MIIGRMAVVDEETKREEMRDRGEKGEIIIVRILITIDVDIEIRRDLVENRLLL